MKTKTLSLVLALAVCLGLTVPTFAVSEQKTVHASNEAELLAALNSNTTIILENKTYTTRLELRELENVTIQGTGSTRIVVNNGTDDVISLAECNNITLSGLVLGHDIPVEDGCSSGVIYGWGGSNLTILNCDIFGCGLEGICIEGSVEMRDSIIRDCSYIIMSLYDGQFTFQNCTFSGNGYELGPFTDCYGIYVGAYEKEATLTFNDCTFSDNKATVFLEAFEGEGNKVSYTLNNCSFRGNAWPEITAPSGAAAMPTNDSLTCNGKAQNPTVYKIGDSNYFKIRDLAAMLNGTEKRFSVGYDNATQSVTATTGQAYTLTGTELAGAPSASAQAELSNDAIYVNGQKAEVEVYKIDGSNYFKLRDLGKALNFYVGWTAEEGMYIETDKPYTE